MDIASIVALIESFDIPDARKNALILQAIAQAGTVPKDPPPAAAPAPSGLAAAPSSGMGGPAHAVAGPTVPPPDNSGNWQWRGSWSAGGWVEGWEWAGHQNLTGGYQPGLESLYQYAQRRGVPATVLGSMTNAQQVDDWVAAHPGV